MLDKSCGGLADCWARVAFVKSDGTWVYSYTDITSDTYTYTEQPDFQKKPLCRNNANFTDYYAECVASYG
jgi:hypothetical protein